MAGIIKIGSASGADYDISELRDMTHPDSEDRHALEETFLVGFRNPSLEEMNKIEHFLRVFNDYSSTDLETLIPGTT